MAQEAPRAIEGSDSASEFVDHFQELSGDLTVRYLKVGEGPLTVVFIPGWTMHAEVFEHQLRRLALRPEFTTIVFEPRSHGKSSMTESGNYYEQHARDLHEFLTALHIDECVLIGWSAGAADILAYLQESGSARVRGVAFIDIPPTFRGYDCEEEWVEFGTKGDGDQSGMLRYFCHDLMVDRAHVTRHFVTWMLEDPTPDKVEFFTQMTMTTPLTIATILNMSFWFVDGADELITRDGEFPVLYFVREDRGEVARRWAEENTPHAAVDAFGTHASFWERPERFNATLDGFLDRVTSSVGSD